MRRFGLFLLSLSLFAAVDSTVLNVTTGKPQAGVQVSLIQPSEKGMEPIAQATSTASGDLKFDVTPKQGAPLLMQATYKGVTYTKQLMLGQPSALEVYETTGSREGVGVRSHGIFMEPTGDKVGVREFVFIDNKSKSTFVDAANGTYRFWAPDGAKVEVSITSQGGMPLRRPAAKAGAANTWKIDYPLKPGQTQLELSYEVEKSGEGMKGNILHKEGETRLIVPRGLKLKGDGLEEYEPEPRTQAMIYGVKNGPFAVTFEGKAEAAPAEAQGNEGNTGSPEIQPGRPRIYSRLYWILALAGAMLAVGLFSLARSK